LHRSCWFQSEQRLCKRRAASPADLIVIDYMREVQNPTEDRWRTKSVPVSRAEVQKLRSKPGQATGQAAGQIAGQRDRLVIAYLSIGEAEEYRDYWRPEWAQRRPDWLLAENCRWPSNHLVQFWQQAWKDIIFSGPNSYLDRIMAAGFDGLYLDRVDVYWDIRRDFADSRRQMLRFIEELAATARSRQPDFLLIAQNAEALLSDASYRRTIDAIAKEDLFRGVGATGQRNDPDLVAWSLGQLKLMQRAKKPVFVVEYLTTPEAIAATKQEAEARRLVATFPTRALDGGDPLNQGPLRKAAGTPEFRAEHCKTE
jgi:cysteinyl-tRNA synthetase, unknown class